METKTAPRGTREGKQEGSQRLSAEQRRRRRAPSERLRAQRAERVRTRERDERWKNPPVRIEKWECIVCDSCMRECPPQFGAIFNDGIDVKVIPELCSGCNRCVAVCPVDCIYPDPEWRPTEETEPQLWEYAGGNADPYVHARSFDL
jgi:Na+-translocating ferredoxin:NAD+ oxidoreductase subunit B